MKSKYLRFKHTGLSISRKTKCWSVFSKRDSTVLGVIMWFSRWRQYCFFPAEYTVFNKGCLADIQQFITQQMDARRK